MRLYCSKKLSVVATMMLALVCLAGEAFSEDRLTEVGARLSAFEVNTAQVTVSREIILAGDKVMATFVMAHTASGKVLQRNHLGYWIPWNGKLSSIVDNHFWANNGRVLFKILKDENMSAELFPVRITIAYKTLGAFKFGVFDILDDGRSDKQ